MGDMMEKASAIWEMLDNLMEKDPEAYARFIQQQMKEGAALFGEEEDNKGKGQAKGASASGDGGAKEKQSNQSKSYKEVKGQEGESSLLDEDVGTLFKSLRIQGQGDAVGDVEEQVALPKLLLPEDSLKATNAKKTQKNNKLIQELN